MSTSRMPRTIAMVWLAVLAVLALGIPGCSPPKEYDVSPPSFVDASPIKLDVAEIRINNQFFPQGPGHAENAFPTPPAEVVKLWANQRLRAVGHSKILEVVIQDASVIETKLKRKGGIEGDFTDEPSERYNSTIAVSLRIYGGDRGISEANAETKVSRMKEATEKMSVFARREMFAQMSRDLGRQLDQSLTTQINQYFSNYLKF